MIDIDAQRLAAIDRGDVTKAEEKALRDELEHAKISSADLLHQFTEAAKDAAKACAEVSRLRAENAGLQSKLDRLKNTERNHAVLGAEFRMVRSELERVWSFLRKERGIEVPDTSDSCPF